MPQKEGELEHAKQFVLLRADEGVKGLSGSSCTNCSMLHSKAWIAAAKLEEQLDCLLWDKAQSMTVILFDQHTHNRGAGQENACFSVYKHREKPFEESQHIDNAIAWPET